MNISSKREQNDACISSAEREKFGTKFKAKTIFKTLALAMLMPAMLLTASCSNEDLALNNTAETTAKQGYTLPVTVSVTRQGDQAGTRATYDDETKKLAFSEGDKLFVYGSDDGAGDFAGTLTWQSGGTFSGDITTENEYTGTIDDLFTAGDAFATLLPNGYGDYGYLSINDNGTPEADYDDFIRPDNSKAFATSKAKAVEQFSYESCPYSSGTGFALRPSNAILSFTITGLTANTSVVVSFSDSFTTISKSVTTDGDGTATFAIGVLVSTDLKDEISLTVGGNAITLVSEDKSADAGHIYNITRSVAPAP